jgi:arylsulfatase A-like enzyme
MASSAFFSVACSPEPVDDRPSIVLIVIDTLRADAVSSYGAVENTTPVIDGLAAEGVRYEHAYAPSSWTLPSHVSLFTGLRVDEHGVGLRGVKAAQSELHFLAEKLSEAGYETAGFAENPAVGPAFGVDQGFQTFAAPAIESVVEAIGTGVDPTNRGFALVERVRAWNAARDRTKPFFLFVNIYDPHYSFQIRNENVYLPEGFGRTEIWYAAQKIDFANSLCDRVPDERSLAILRGLYLGDVAAADFKAGRVLEALGPEEDARSRITVVTSDHGEHLGEHRLLAHRFTVRNEALQIPLVVVGAGESMRGVASQPVDLLGVHRSVLCWAGLSECSGTLPPPGEAPSPSDGPSIVSIFSDEVLTLPPEIAERMGFEPGYRDAARDACKESDRVFGRMVSLLRYPLKLTWVQDEPTELHDLSWDPGEQTDLASLESDEARALREEMERFLDESGLREGYAADSDVHPLDPEAVRALEALGYIDRPTSAP